MRHFRLDRLARLLGVTRHRAYAYHGDGLIGGRNGGPGRSHGVTMTRRQAEHAAGVLLLAGALPARVARRAVVRALADGRDVLTLGIDPTGRGMLLDGTASRPRAARGRGLLLARVRVGELRAEINAILQRLEAG